MVALRAETSKQDDHFYHCAPVDLVFLSSLSMGDRALETEILGMFAGQLPNYLSAVCMNDAPEHRMVALHTLKGAAKSVGALQLSELAKKLEEDPALSNDDLLQEAERVAEFIASISS